ncbi:2-octaprenyl-3-methyl-6-methoxy-1,4-benzoquinol hydroxylase [Rhodobacteraceae bacterium THAF1]|uniref:FAD-dependent monooxygenase n=1 Tax=Palleronia sp. THAF1 TaxID=2587842 RepID=UPI000F3D929B|nr:FAD-dependent monooxygenase [Palleronia sp. THAF1]QFU07524.1 2-octaprenyl-3-methyl-6-methoxy-1,4-benzoquinol hydroxylase [Palleronia sp. THAF1]VDC20487.1 2-octaprenyl-3-methyl-6-methoxy-1,4-benzoquinol hydroxylase [Rhodobacteraceae bacterium THAF1]
MKDEPLRRTGRDLAARAAYLERMEKTDIFISGAGIAGMILAALLAKRGHTVTVCDPSTPADAMSDEDSDLRSTAYLAPSIAVLEEAGLWQHLAPDATPLEALRVMDSTGWPPRQTATRTFRPGDLDLPAFGQNVMNWRAHRILLDALNDASRVNLRLGVGFRSMLARENEVRVTLTDGSRLSAALVIGADGRNSPVRGAAGIEARDRRYGQKALAFACTHADPHQHVSTEVYNGGGAFVTVPLPDHEGQHASSIVWMSTGARIAELQAMNAEAFDAELTERALHIMGPMQRITPMRVWPIITRTADALTARRTALVAEAAHVLPPIGAQGLNTSIADIAALADAIEGGDPGRDAALETYARSRHRDMAIRATAIDAYNRLCQADSGPLQALRSAGLKAVHDLGPLRRNVMMAGMGGA